MGGWKRVGEDVFCPACRDSLYTLRAVTIPVLHPVDQSLTKEFWKALRASWDMATKVANWMMTECAKRDAHPADGKLPPMPKIYLYPEARAFAPALFSQTVSAIEQSVKGTYRKARFDVWRGARSLPSFRYPLPLPVPAQSWSARWLNATDRVPVISVNLCGVRFDLKLKAGPHFRPQHKDFAALVDGAALPGELALMERGKTLMAKLVMRVPKVPHVQEKEKAMVVKTDPDSLLIGAIGENELWRYNADHARRYEMEYLRGYEAGHVRRIGRLQEDSKLERRTGEVPDPAMFREKLCTKRNNRMDSICHQATAAAVNRAVRYRCSMLVFDGADETFLPSFPWFKLKTFLEYKTRAAGIEFMDTTTKNASGEVAGVPGTSARKEETEL
jgi:hypothetical protein